MKTDNNKIEQINNNTKLETIIKRIKRLKYTKNNKKRGSLLYTLNKKFLKNKHISEKTKLLYMKQSTYQR